MERHAPNGAPEPELRDLGPNVVRLGVELVPLTFALRFPSSQPACVLRIFRGVVKDGIADAYVEAARSGAVADASNGEGPLGIFLGFTGEQRFVTVSAWPDWSTIQSRTGGNPLRQIATQHAEMLLSGTAEHYEILPDAVPRARA